MVAEYILAPNARWQGRNSTGAPVVNGKLYTYVNGTVTPKATYQDYEGSQANTNPVILDAKGEANIYWATDEYYTIKLYDSGNNLIYTQNNYPVTGFTSAVPSQNYYTYNFIRNCQFASWSNSTSYIFDSSYFTYNDFVADDWYYGNNATGFQVNISRQTFALGDNSTGNNPTFFFRYQCNTTGTGGTYNRLTQDLNSVQTLSGQEISVSLWMKGSSGSPLSVSVSLVQNFGSGGSPSSDVTTSLLAATVTSSWTQFTGTVTLPSVTGKSRGTNLDDVLYLAINFPVSQLCTVDVADVQLQKGSEVTTFIQKSQDDQIQGTDVISLYSNFSTGDLKFTLKATADQGWVMCNDSTIGNVASAASNKGISTKALYVLLWNNVSNTYAPVSTGRGASAEADFNANKTLTLTRVLGRALAGAGAGSGLTSRALGEILGEEKHTMTTGELVAHTHTGTSTISGNVAGGAPNGITFGADNQNTTLNVTLTTASTGSTTPFNVMQPTTFYNVMVKL